MLRWTFAFFLVYGYAIFLGSTMAKTPDGWVTQNVELGSVAIVGSEESPIGLQSTDLEWVDQNHVLQRVPGVIVGNVPVDSRCDVKVVPPAFKASTTTSITTTTIFGSKSTVTAPGATTPTITLPPGVTLPPGMTLPPGVSEAPGAATGSSTSTTTTAPGPKPIPGTTKVDDVKTACLQSIEIRYDPAKPAQTVQVVGAKDLEVGLPALAYLILVGIVGFCAFLISLGSTGFPPGEPKGSLVVGVIQILISIGCLVGGTFFVWQEPVVAMSMVLPALYFLFRGSTNLRRRLRRRGPEAASASPGPPAPDPYPSQGSEPWTAPSPDRVPAATPQTPGSPSAGPPAPWPGSGQPQAPQPPAQPPTQPPTPWSNPPPQPSFQPPPNPPDPDPGTATSF